MTKAPKRIVVDTILLDLDDTLIREHDFVLSGYSAVAAELAPALGIADSDIRSRLIQIYDSPDRSRAFNTLLEPFGRLDLVHSCINTYRTHYPQIELTPSANALLRALDGRVALGVVTDGPLAMQEAKVVALGLRDRCIEVVCTDSIGGKATWKPSPAGILEVLTRLDADPTRAVYIADNPHKDFLASARAGVHSIRLRHEGQLHAACEAEVGGAPDHEISDLIEALDLLVLPTSSNT